MRGFLGFLRGASDPTVGRVNTYLVEAYVTKLDGALAAQLASAVHQAALTMTRRGTPIRYLRSIFVPEDETCFHLLEAQSVEALRRASRENDFAFVRIVEAVESGATVGSDEERSLLMAQYMVERHLAGFPPEQLPAAAGAAKEKALELMNEGVDVRYVRSTWVPDGERCYCLFESSSTAAVEEVQKRANLPFERIHEAAFVTAEDV